MFQGVALLAALSVLGFVAYDLYDDARDPSPRPAVVRRRPRPATKAFESPRAKIFVEPSVEIWTDSQGETRGRVKRGPCRGMRLDEMSREECEAQNTYCREHDYPAALALEAYIRLRFSQAKRNATRVDGAMSRAQALAELGLSEAASEKEINAAYRALIKRHHPDRGGSTARAARLNQAKDLLVG
jgi:hypothetical protein